VLHKAAYEKKDRPVVVALVEDVREMSRPSATR